MGKNAKAARSLDRAIIRLNPPDCLVSLDPPEKAFLTMGQERGKKTEKKRQSRMRMRTRKGEESLLNISRNLSSIPGRPKSRRDSSPLRRKVRSALIIVNQTSGRRTVPAKEARSCASTIIVEIGENIGEKRGAVTSRICEGTVIVKYRPISLCSTSVPREVVILHDEILVFFREIIAHDS